jgi:hypothetical protein
MFVKEMTATQSLNKIEDKKVQRSCPFDRQIGIFEMLLRIIKNRPASSIDQREARAPGLF